MKELNLNEINIVSGGVPPMLIFYGAYVLLGPSLAAGVAAGVREATQP